MKVFEDSDFLYKVQSQALQAGDRIAYLNNKDRLKELEDGGDELKGQETTDRGRGGGGGGAKMEEIWREERTEGTDRDVQAQADRDGD